MVRMTAVQVGDFGVFPEAMFNLRGLLFRLLGVGRVGLVNGLSLAALLTVLTVIAWLAWRNRGEDVVARRLRLALSIQLGLLVTPHLNPTDTLLFVVPAMLLWSAAPRWRALVAGVYLCCPLLLAVDLYGLPPGSGRPFVWVMIAMAGVMGWRYHVPGRARSTTPTTIDPDPNGRPNLHCGDSPPRL